MANQWYNNLMVAPASKIISGLGFITGLGTIMGTSGDRWTYSVTPGSEFSSMTNNFSVPGGFTILSWKGIGIALSGFTTNKTYTVSGITGPNSLLNGTTLVAYTDSAGKGIYNIHANGGTWRDVFKSLNLPTSIYNQSINTQFPGLTLNWN
jgi:hypothetical protein